MTGQMVPEDCGPKSELLTPEIGAKYPRCINGGRHEEITEWIGRKFDPEEFDLAMTNQILRQLFP